jgi:glutathione S-transferase
MELTATPFVCGQHPTLADIAIFTSVDYLRLAGFDCARFAALAAWFGTCAGRQAWSETAHLP